MRYRYDGDDNDSNGLNDRNVTCDVDYDAGASR